MAPSFWGTKTWDNCNTTTTQGTKAQFMWFCNDSVNHTWQLCNTITHYPAKVPDTWHVERGTNITNIEIKMLENGGYKLAKKSAIAIRNVRYCVGVSKVVVKIIDLAISMEARIDGHEVVRQGHHKKFIVSTSSSKVRDEAYEVHIATSLMCTCKDFVEHAT